jgi:hypothetical protein
MPVACSDHELETVGETVDRRADLVSALDRERAARSEVVLEVCDEQRVYQMLLGSKKI